ncbi:hypothetical protein N9H39_00705 [Gammaproteobacteria bacterium]|nr:hypothetical protein [Gammaproteobacteria bacterium]|tara:strand:- start:1736 stop:2182 length:447 start_codon:yes stop_codon:yes gene_type:complete
MENKVDVKKTVFNKPQYIKTIDTTFSELGVTNMVEDIESTVDVTKFFEYYDELFYEIPATGETNSHEFLVKTSGEYINYDQDSDIIQALQEEISALRQENLNLEIRAVKAETGEDISIDPSLDVNIANSEETQTDVLSLIGANGLNGL